LRSRLTIDLLEEPASLDLTDATLQLRRPSRPGPSVLAREEFPWHDYSAERIYQDPLSRAAVRCFDVTTALAGLILLAPIMAAVALAVRIDSPGPVFYGSPRIGHRKPQFNAWKFRSMHRDADTLLANLLATDERAREEYEVFHKLRKDPRLTKVGSFIRRTSLDELPQLVNILMGEMSVVGPRPKLLKDAEVFGSSLDVILQVRPGLTGLWQVSGRNRLPVEDRIELDLDYARGRTLLGDIKICFKTFVQLWRPGKHGAY
jgi:lipopolysaccharide/colanic/teichoic acid biosynthesis glycosyltransferase